MEEQKYATRVVDAQVYIPMIRSILEEGKTVPMIITGSSMTPFLVSRRDRIFLKKAEDPLHVGDMAFFRRPNGQYVFHRIWGIRPEGYYFLGDAQTEVEGPSPGRPFLPWPSRWSERDSSSAPGISGGSFSGRSGPGSVRCAPLWCGSMAGLWAGSRREFSARSR